MGGWVGLVVGCVLFLCLDVCMYVGLSVCESKRGNGFLLVFTSPC